jgi:glycosyltransferase involved in cell wall biosynthesis
VSPENGITVSIATIPPRRSLLKRAVNSVLGQELAPAALVVQVDTDKAGAVATKNRALSKVTTEWVAFLDDDDEFLPSHLPLCMAHALETDADVVYPWPVMCGAVDAAPDRFGRAFDPAALRRFSYIPTTALVRTQLAKDVGGFQHPGRLRSHAYDDWGLWLAMLDAGATFSHLPERTWIWHVHGQNTGGLTGAW